MEALGTCRYQAPILTPWRRQDFHRLEFCKYENRCIDLFPGLVNFGNSKSSKLLQQSRTVALGPVFRIFKGIEAEGFPGSPNPFERSQRAIGG